jgi:hypothetical protein
VSLRVRGGAGVIAANNGGDRGDDDGVGTDDMLITELDRPRRDGNVLRLCSEARCLYGDRPGTGWTCPPSCCRPRAVAWVSDQGLRACGNSDPRPPRDPLPFAASTLAPVPGNPAGALPVTQHPQTASCRLGHLERERKLGLCGQFSPRLPWIAVSSSRFSELPSDLPFFATYSGREPWQEGMRWVAPVRGSFP